MLEGSPTGGRIGGGTLNAWDNCINDFINHGDALIIKKKKPEKEDSSLHLQMGTRHRPDPTLQR